MRLVADSQHSQKQPALIVRSDGPFASVQMWRGSGIAVPVFSLRTASSIGAGEFSDLKKLADFCAATGVLDGLFLLYLKALPASQLRSSLHLPEYALLENNMASQCGILMAACCNEA